MDLVITVEERNAIAQALQRVVSLALNATSNPNAVADAMVVEKFTKALAGATGVEVKRVP
jgi:hypothetical protein